jgi:putative hydrolase of the HAD superfamily
VTPPGDSSKVILFDLGGVLVRNNGRAALAALLPAPLEADRIWLKWLSSPSVREFERGRISAEAFASGFIDEWQIRLEPSAFISEFATWPAGLFAGAEPLLRALKTRHHVACLSNTNTVHWQRLTQLHGLFDSAFLSHEMGHVKPDPEAFEFAIEKLGVAPGHIYFFDDLRPNVEAARKAGMRAFEVEDFTSIEPILRSENLYGD